MFRALCLAGIGMACGSTMAQSSVTLAGTVDLGIRHVRNGSLGSVTSEVSGANATSKLILRAVEESGGNYNGAARLLGLHPNYLHRLIKNLQLKSTLKSS